MRRNARAFETWVLTSLLAAISIITFIYLRLRPEGEVYEVTLLGAIIGFPFVMRARFALTPFVWTGLFLASLAWMCGDSHLFAPIFFGRYTAIFFALPLMSGGFTSASRVLWGNTAAVRAFSIWTFLICAMALIVAEIGLRNSEGGAPFRAYLPGYFLFAVSFLAVFFGAAYSRVQRLYLLGTLLSLVAAFHIQTWGLQGWAHSGSALMMITSLGLFSAFQRSVGNRLCYLLGVALVSSRALYFLYEAYVASTVSSLP